MFEHIFFCTAGGEQCKKGMHTRSTRITLFCAKYDSEPIFIRETETCEYIFEWHTPVACPKHVVYSDSCEVTDPLYNFTYDLSPLRNLANDYSTNDGTTDFWVNICGPVVGNYDSLSTSSSVIMRNGDSFVSGGSTEASLIFNDGTLTMKFVNGSQCGTDDKRSSNIIFLCDHESNDTNFGLSVFRHDSTCENNFVWRTKHACPPHDVVDCSVIDVQNVLKYDLNPLSLSNMNQEEVGADKDEKFILNVCRSVVHSKTARCAYNAAACLVDESHKNVSLNIGSVGTGPYLDKGRLKLKYENGDICKADPSKRYTTEIYFECDTFDYFPYPNLIAREDCTFIFEWKTKFACAEQLEAISTLGNCSASNKYTNYDYNLSPLKKSSAYKITGHGITMKLNVCGAVNDPDCPDGTSGACVRGAGETTFSNAGVATAELLSTPGTLSLRYVNGSACSNGVKRTTIISFFCGAENTIEGPVLVSIDNDSCTYFVNWHTERACEMRTNCLIRGYASVVDLRSLIKHNSNYEIQIPASENSTDSKFYLNVCRPVNHVIGANCVAGSSVCLVHHNTTSDKDEAVSLGKPMMPPILKSDESAVLLYTLGSQCLEVPGLKYTSRITFVCDRTSGHVSICFHYKKAYQICYYIF